MDSLVTYLHSVIRSSWLLSKLVPDFSLNQLQSNSSRHVNEVSHIHEETLYNVYILLYLASIFVTTVAVIVLIFYLYQLLFVPLNRVRRLGSIGYINHESSHMSKKELVNMVRRRRKLGRDIPPVYPNGWYRVIDSVQLKKGEVKEASLCGRNVAVFRGSNGKAALMSTYCAHMGGNIGAGGRVKGNSVQCPFHGWVFGQDGACQYIPYSAKVPKGSQLKTWPMREVNGVIFMWYHVDEIEPQWEIPEIKEIVEKEFYYRGRCEHHINTHIQDIPENGSDVAHLSHLHVPSVLSGVNLANIFDSWISFANHIFTIEPVGTTEETPHISTFTMKHYIHFFKKWKFINIDLTVHQIGPGIVHLHMNTPLGKAVLVQTLSPMEPMVQNLIHSYYTNWKLLTFISKLVLTFEAIQVDRDVMVWNNKTFEPRPLLVKEDALISKYRRWFSQFYSQNSVRLTLKDDDNLDW